MQDTSSQPLLTLNSLKKYYRPPRSFGDIVRRRAAPLIRACDDVSLTIAPGETLGLVGESGAGKTTVARLVLALERPDSGSIEFNGKSLFDLGGQELRSTRRDMQLVFQDPLSSLNPRHSVLRAISHPLRVHGEVDSKTEALTAVLGLLEMVGLPEILVHRFPHELSRGQAQRVCIARAIALRPKLIVADEPTSALDVSVQAQILNLMKRLQQELSMAYLFISHDLRVVHHFSENVAVMYAGQIVETGAVRQIFSEPRHPYTRALLDSVPRTKALTREERSVTLGEAFDAAMPLSGCRFEPRCPFSEEECLEPQLLRPHGVTGGQVRCILDHLPGSRVATPEESRRRRLGPTG